MPRLLPVAVLLAAIAGCAGDSSRIVGVWVSINEPTARYNRQLTLTKEGYYRMISVPRPTTLSRRDPTLLPEEAIGTYTVMAGRLTLNSSTPGVPSVQYKIASLTDTSLVLETVTGPIVIMRFTRVPTR